MVRRQLAEAQKHLEAEQGHLADIELHLRDNGVDLAAVDAEAEKARPKQSPLLTGALDHGYGQRGSNLGNVLTQMSGVNRNNTFDPTAALAKAPDEA